MLIRAGWDIVRAVARQRGDKCLLMFDHPLLAAFATVKRFFNFGALQASIPPVHNCSDHCKAGQFNGGCPCMWFQDYAKHGAWCSGKAIANRTYRYLHARDARDKQGRAAHFMTLLGKYGCKPTGQKDTVSFDTKNDVMQTLEDGEFFQELSVWLRKPGVVGEFFFVFVPKEFNCIGLR